MVDLYASHAWAIPRAARLPLRVSTVREQQTPYQQFVVTFVQCECVRTLSNENAKGHLAGGPRQPITIRQLHGKEKFTARRDPASHTDPFGAQSRIPSFDGDFQPESNGGGMDVVAFPHSF